MLGVGSVCTNRIVAETLDLKGTCLMTFAVAEKGEAMKSDPISRQYVIDGINELRKSPWFNQVWSHERAEALDIVEQLCVKDAPTIGGWIPCSERMPSEDGNYLVTVEFDYGREVEMGWLLDGEWMNPNSHVTVAWMPLPEPVLI